MRIIATGHDHFELPNEKSVFLIEWLTGRKVQISTKFNYKNKTKTIVDNFKHMLNGRAFSSFFNANAKLAGIVNIFDETKQKWSYLDGSIIKHEITDGTLFTKGSFTVWHDHNGTYRLRGTALAPHTKTLEVMNKLDMVKPSPNKNTFSITLGGELVSFEMSLTLTVAEFKKMMAMQYSTLPQA